MPDPVGREPRTPAEWRVAVVAAAVWLRVDTARQYGLITGGPDIDVDRCVDLLERGRARGIRPTEAAVDRALAVIAAGLAAGAGAGA